MNKRNKEQLRAAIANDLVQGQGDHSPPRELLRQYAPLEGIATKTAPNILPQAVHLAPVENSLAPRATLARGTTVAQHATNKDDDDKNKKQSSSKGRTFTGDSKPVENHRRAAAPRERQDTADGDFALVRAAYEKATENRWNKSDSEAYDENGIVRVPVDKIISAIEAVTRRTPVKINSFKYFVQEIVTIPDPQNRAWQKKQLERIIRRIRDNAVGRSGYTSIDFLEDVKHACARENVVFNNDIFNEFVR
jgi:hypothetical protein